MYAEYCCLFGIATPINSLESGEFDVGYQDNKSSLVVVGQGGRIYYFILERLDKVYKMSEMPKYTAAEATEYAQRHAGMNIRQNIKFADLWSKTLSFRLVVLEEADYKVSIIKRLLWTFGRF
jgi:hypothetical protein